MKRFVYTSGLLFIFCSIAALAKAQRIEVQNTYSYLVDKDLPNARKCIDKAAYHPQSCNLLKTWKLRAEVYEKVLQERVIPTDAALDSVVKSLQHWLSLEKDPAERQYAAGKLFNYANSWFMTGIYKYFNHQPRIFDTAFHYIAKAEALTLYLKPYMKQSVYYDSLLALSRIDMAFCSYQMKRPVRETDSLLQLVNDNPIAAIENKFILQALLARDRKDTIARLRHIQEGLALHPYSLVLINEEAIYHIKHGVPASFLTQLEQLIKAKPEEADLYFFLGMSANQYLRQPAVNNDEALYKTWIEKAGIAYQAALQRQPDNPVFTYNYGVLIFNHSVHYNEQMNQLGREMVKQPQKWDELEARRHAIEKLRDASMLLASVQLEKSIKLMEQTAQSDDLIYCNALRALDRIYMLVNDYSKEQQTRQMLAAFDRCTENQD